MPSGAHGSMVYQALCNKSPDQMPIVPQASRKSVMAGFLTCPQGHAFPAYCQWLLWRSFGRHAYASSGLTAAGTVPVFHRIPYPLRCKVNNYS